ncbi:hypothetical protein FACS189430_09280 [Bacteroidia bacterium]|nr:hypothetical protein FACS189430_09280 [Bacteroidia bacterium]
MENKISYQTLTERLRKTPILEQPEKLTQTVIEKIERMEANRLKHKVMYITGWLSGVAAALLLALLILETAQTPATYRMKTDNIAVASAPVASDAYRAIAVHAADKSFAEKRHIVASIIKEKRDKAIQKEQLYRFMQNK